MDKKILAIGMVAMFLLTGFSAISTGTVKQEQSVTSSNFDNAVEIRIAIYSMGNLSLSGRLKYFDIFDGYQWQVGDKTYRFSLTEIDDKGILRGELNKKNYDVFTIDWMEATLLAVRFSQPSIKNFILKTKIANFIKEGGGYFGSCAGSLIMGSGLSNKPETIFEKEWDRGSMHISQVKSFLQNGYFIIDQPFNHPEKTGTGSYVWFSGWDENNKSQIGGCCLDVIVDKNNPIFNDIIGDTRLIRWIGGPANIIPEQSSNVKAIAYYPHEEMSDNKSTQVHAWKYTGGLIGLIRSSFSVFKATDWEMTDIIIQTNLADKPFMTMETYPNENQGRIVLCGGHPEDAIWLGGHIEESNDTSSNNLFDSLHHWTNYTDFNRTYNWCIFRREAAWAGKVPDNDLPPIYGPSQVSDIYPYDQPSKFNVTGNAETANGTVSLDLYYRYSADNGTTKSWSDWTLYGTDNDISDGWSWEFNAPNGIGYYQFYSIRHVEYDDFTETETAPPGPDAIAYVYEG